MSTDDTWQQAEKAAQENVPNWDVLNALVPEAFARASDAVAFQDPANWTREQAQAAQAELDELKRTDPAVAAAAASYDRMVERVTGKAWFGNGRQTDEQRIATPAERAAADELTELTEEMGLYDEPDPSDLDKARFAIWPEAVTGDPDGRFWQNALDGDKEAVKRVALALAAERAAIHARYEAVAAQLERTASRYTMSSEQHSVRAIAAHLIRQVAAQ